VRAHDRCGLILKENNKRLRYLMADEIKNLLLACSDHLRPIVVCAINTGMRRGEILGLKWDQIRGGFIYLLKTNESHQIPINDDPANLFKQIRKEHQLKSEYVSIGWKGIPINSVKKKLSGGIETR
jgi:integrase